LAHGVLQRLQPDRDEQSFGRQCSSDAGNSERRNGFRVRLHQHRVGGVRSAQRTDRRTVPLVESGRERPGEWRWQAARILKPMQQTAPATIAGNKPVGGKRSMLWILFTLGAILSWGVYGVALHKGQVTLGSPLKALLCVGGAYFVIGVLAPVLALSGQGGLSG